jgi:hypothetical protein
MNTVEKFRTKEMKRFRFASLLTVAVLAVLAVRAAEPAAVQTRVSELTWLVGQWKLERNGRVTTERWDAPGGNMMLGTSQAVAKEKTVDYEFLVIREDPNGDIFYVAKPARQPEAAFKLVRATARHLVFENPTHDFPQRISYTLQPDGVLLAAIEGTKDGKTRRVEFPYRPVK